MGGGDPSAIFGSELSTSSEYGSVSHTKSHKISNKMTNSTKPTESIVHRLNHLTLLINSSGIDLNIALNESNYQSLDALQDSVVEDLNTTLIESSAPNKTLASLSSQSKKRRSVLLNITNNQNNVEQDKKNSTKQVKFAPSVAVNNVSYVGKEGLLDAFLALYDECCSNEEYKKDPLLQEFVKKCKNYVFIMITCLLFIYCCYNLYLYPH